MYYGRGGSSVAVLMLLAFIGSIVLTVLAYNRYVRDSQDKLLNLRDESALRAFLRFDTLLIDRILKVLYLFAAISLPLFSVAFVLGVLFSDFGAGIIMLVVMAIATVVGEVLVRLSYESLMLNVIVARNTRDIKRAMGIADEPEAPRVESTPAASYAQPAPGQLGQLDLSVSAPHAEHGYAPVQAAPVQAAPTSWDVPSAPAQAAAWEAPASVPAASAAEPAVVVCPSCGSPVRQGAKFCGVCGTSLR